jgi:hypothetical protein
VDSLTLAQPTAPNDLARGLSDKAVRFAEVRASGIPLHRAVVLAGFAPKNKRNATSIGWSLSQDPRVVALMEHYAHNLVRGAAPRAVRVLDHIMSDATVKPADRTRAAKGLLDKVLPTQLHHETEGHLRHDHEHVHRAAPTLDDLRREAGLLPSPANVIDAEFEVIDASEWVVD